ncbi:hypothetical protein DMC30DRAFT_372177 [Rhodotorula diobovata]|uniref:Chromatin modification-related protein n=1 Tax=Rhodotorula diobovata TaxID=5288 RepID=A0A5C5G492_9BASI|nr:hypothetical protein DMC30DRAFT_372177 [Rhodotorula diobovata]
MAATPRPAKRRRTDNVTVAPQSTPAVDVASEPRVDATTTTTLEGEDNARHDPADEPKARSKEEQEELERRYDLIAEEYHDILSELPLEYQRTFQLMRELEDSQQDHETGLRSSLEAYIVVMQTATAAPSPAASTSTAEAEPPRLSPAAREHLAKLSEHANKAVRAADDKHGLAVTLYEMVDRHIRRLDADLAKYEDSLVIGLRDGTLPSHDAPAATRKSPPGATTSLGAIALGEHEAYASVGAGAGGEAEAEGGARVSRRRATMTPAEREKEREWKRSRELQKQERALKRKAEQVNMPIDPNEPTYCYCNRVSFGEMIACENEDCSREWFHLGCVGLEKAPEGVWYCDDCVRELNLDPATMQRRG